MARRHPLTYKTVHWSGVEQTQARISTLIATFERKPPDFERTAEFLEELNFEIDGTENRITLNAAQGSVEFTGKDNIARAGRTFPYCTEALRDLQKLQMRVAAPVDSSGAIALLVDEAPSLTHADHHIAHADWEVYGMRDRLALNANFTGVNLPNFAGARHFLEKRLRVLTAESLPEGHSREIRILGKNNQAKLIGWIRRYDAPLYQRFREQGILSELGLYGDPPDPKGFVENFTRDKPLNPSTRKR